MTLETFFNFAILDVSEHNLGVYALKHARRRLAYADGRAGDEGNFSLIHAPTSNGPSNR